MSITPCHLPYLAFLLFFSSLFPSSISASSLPNNTHLANNTDVGMRNGSRYLYASTTLINQFLVPHNQIRAKLGVPPLKWSRYVENYAAWWANQRRGDCGLIHSDSNYGENIFWGSGKGWSAGQAVAAWYSEKPFYNYRMNTCRPGEDCGHYTQIIWKSSRYLGCAKITCNSGDTFITCNYDPHGNVIGRRPY